MVKSADELIRLSKPLFAAGMILGVWYILQLGRSSDISLNQEGEGFKIISISFLLSEIVSIALGKILCVH